MASYFGTSCSKSKRQTVGADGDRARVEEKPFNRDQYVLEAMIAERERLARNRDNPQSKVKMLNLDLNSATNNCFSIGQDVDTFFKGTVA